jgi:hypothetical protein
MWWSMLIEKIDDLVGGAFRQRGVSLGLGLV